MHCYPRSERPRSGFTLVELLVVVAIIAIIAAIAFPSYRSFMESGARTKDLGKLKALGAALMGYSADNGGKLPGPIPTPVRAMTSGASTPYTLADRLWPYAEGSPVPLGEKKIANFLLFEAAKKAWNRDLKKNAEEITILATRRANLGEGTGRQISPAYDPWGWKKSSGIADNAPQNSQPWTVASLGLRPGKDGKVSNPSKDWAFCDVDARSIYAAKIEASKDHLAPDTLHGKFRLFMFFDGHVEARPRAETDL